MEPLDFLYRTICPVHFGRIPQSSANDDFTFHQAAHAVSEDHKAANRVMLEVRVTHQYNMKTTSQEQKHKSFTNTQKTQKKLICV